MDKQAMYSSTMTLIIVNQRIHSNQVVGINYSIDCSVLDFILLEREETTSSRAMLYLIISYSHRSDA